MRYFLLFIILFNFSCEKKNIFNDFSSEDSDEALLLEAKDHLDKFRYDKVIEIVETRISSTFRTQNKVQSVRMFAYGGKCGINFLQVVNSMTNTTSTKLFEIAAELFADTPVESVHCEKASEILGALGTSSQRTTNENLFGSILGLAQIGTTLRETLDADNDGVLDGVNICLPSGALTDLKVNRIGAGVGLVFDNILAMTSRIDNIGVLDGLTDAKAICEEPMFPGIGQPEDYGYAGLTWPQMGTALGVTFSDPPTFAQLGLPADIDQPLNCTNTSSSQVNAKTRRVLRRLINSSVAGVGTCDISDVVVNISGSPFNIDIQMDCCPNLEAP